MINEACPVLSGAIFTGPAMQDSLHSATIALVGEVQLATPPSDGSRLEDHH